jgi:serine O-acetyltransferase
MSDTIKLIKTDLYRYCGRLSLVLFIKQYYINPGFKFMVWHRIAHNTKPKGKLIYLFPWLMLRRLKIKYGYDIPAETVIGKGFYIGHFGGIVISSKVIIGNNCNISQGITIGYNSRGKRKGYPKLGDNIYIGPGSVISGNINIGNNAAIGANAVVLDDIPDNAVAVGIPAKIVNSSGSMGYILNPVV